MSQDTFPPNPDTGQVVNQDNPLYGIAGQQLIMTLNNNLELRVKTDNELINAVTALREELNQIRELLKLMMGRM